ncbi:SNF2 family helicase/ATPase [Venturia nashicola]|uniref:SNF2 family helicase/ATPase n=1 Tax=Venturia nashicola TaxID=86259 RepID=A0A4Z1NZ09_9PEZI|nr:SNF2 family helicase/ATPase [Venturia nashicola]
MDSDPIEETPPRRSTAMNYTNGQRNTSQDEYGEDIFDNDTIRQADTIATQPLRDYRPGAMPYSSPSNVSSPPAPQHYTQPTQMLQPQQLTPHRQHNGSQIQVPHSASPPAFRMDNSRFAQPSQAPQFPQQQQQQQSMYNRNMMMPPGTFYRPPMPQPPYPMVNGSGQSVSQLSNFDDPPLAADSDSDGDGHRSDIPPPNFGFQQHISGFYHNPAPMRPQVHKRVAEDSASAYGSVSRPPKIARTVPASTLSKNEYQDMAISHIHDYEEREKVSRMRNVVPNYPIAKLLSWLRSKRGNYDDAINAVMEEMERMERAASGNNIDLSDDEPKTAGVARSTPIQPTIARPSVKHGAAVNGKSILDKYSMLSGPKPPLQSKPATQPRPVAPAPSVSTPSVSSAPSTPLQPVRRRLQQGRRPDRRLDSSPVASPAAPSSQPIAISPPLRTKKRVDPDEYVTDEDVEPEIREDIDAQAFEYFNNIATEQDLRDMANCTDEEATLMLSKRPFKSLDSIRKVVVPPKEGKKKRAGGSQKTLGDRILDKVVDMMTGLEAVDRVVKLCEGYADDLRSSLQKLGIDTDKAAVKDGLAVASLDDESKIDSGVVTPASDVNNFPQQPANMNPEETMKDFQIVGMNWLNLMYTQGQKWSKKSGCILADDMGLGKTLQIISFLSHQLETGNIGPHLVVVPTSTLENWLREFQRFAPAINFQPYSGKQAERASKQMELEEYMADESNQPIHVIVTTYQLAASAKDNTWLRKTFSFNSCIFDEGHMLKNRETERYKALKKIRAKFRVLLTGTPLQNNLQELVSVLAFIMPDLFDDCEEDLNLIFQHRAKTTDEDHAALLSKQRIQRAKTMLTPFILRRTKDQVMKDLPAKTKRVEFCEMTEAQASMYNEYREKSRAVLKARKEGKPVGDEKVPHIMLERLAAIHPILHRTHYDDETIRTKIVPNVPRKGSYKGWSDIKMFEEFTWYSDFELHQICTKYGKESKTLAKLRLKNDEWMDSGKVHKLVELLKQFSAETAGTDKEPNRTLIFSQFKKSLDVLEDVFVTEGIDYTRIDGSTDINDRQDLIDEFYTNKKIQVFMITTKSGGAGINLACANKVIVLDPSFNPQDDIQAENRAHRIGQTREVEVITLISKGTIEVLIHKLGQSKLQLDKRVAGGDDSDAITKRNEALLENMLMNGEEDIPTPPNELADGDAADGSTKKEDGATENGSKQEKGTMDLKDAFAEGMKAKGVDVKSETIRE